MEELKTQWHPAFCSALELILESDRAYLEFIREYNLSKKPLEVDLLVIKKITGHEVGDKIGKIFKEHNIFEYKSPEDEMNIDTFYKVNAYACLYKASSKRVDGIKSGSISISLIREAKPVKLLQDLEREGFVISNPYKGIYYIGDKTYFDTQIIVAKELFGEQYVWLQALTKELDEQTAIRLITSVQGRKGQGDKELADSVLSVSARANVNLFDRMKEDAKMYEVLKELMADEITTAETTMRENTRNEDLKALVDILKRMNLDIDTAYQNIITTEAYANISREQVIKYWQ